MNFQRWVQISFRSYFKLCIFVRMYGIGRVLGTREEKKDERKEKKKKKEDEGWNKKRRDATSGLATANFRRYWISRTINHFANIRKYCSYICFYIVYTRFMVKSRSFGISFEKIIVFRSCILRFFYFHHLLCYVLTCTIIQTLQYIYTHTRARKI